MRIALAGVAHWHAEMHAKAVAAAGSTLGCVWDPDIAMARRFAAMHGAAVAEELDALVTARPDLVVAMGQADRMPELTDLLMDAGLPIVMEKPAALSAAHLAPVEERARKEGHFIAVPLPNRLSPIWAEMAALRADGRLGDLSHAQFRIINGPPERYRRDGAGWVLDPARHGGGALRNLGIHGIDAALSLADAAADQDIEIVGVSLDDRLYGEAVEEYAVVILRMPGGMTVSVEAGYTYASMEAGGDFEWRISTRNAYLTDRGAACAVATLDDCAERTLTPLLPADRYDAFMIDTLGRIARGEPPAVGIGDYARAMRLIDRIYQKEGCR
ncbi:Gfo/Idh/MocA family oxidoreductase [Inquilinus sp. CAU 1745]|uniref:Gfo/Idh/MocA family protein n=1 Tax=Inquilinus sp. CAU 1745 TaxID=3140369 RepID=UPI00325AD8B6